MEDIDDEIGASGIELKTSLHKDIERATDNCGGNHVEPKGDTGALR